MARKKSKKRGKNFEKYLVPSVVALSIIAVLLIVLLTPGFPKRDCETLCKENDFSGAVKSSCMVFTECAVPNYPLTDNVEKVCSDDFDVCCCEP